MSMELGYNDIPNYIDKIVNAENVFSKSDDIIIIDKNIPLTETHRVSMSGPITHDRNLLPQYFKAFLEEVRNSITKTILSSKPKEEIYIDTRCKEEYFTELAISRKITEYLLKYQPKFIIANGKLSAQISESNLYEYLNHNRNPDGYIRNIFLEKHGKIASTSLYTNSVLEWNDPGVLFLNKPIMINMEFLSAVNNYSIGDFIPRLEIIVRFGYISSFYKGIVITKENEGLFKDFIRDDNIKKIID